MRTRRRGSSSPQPPWWRGSAKVQAMAVTGLAAYAIVAGLPAAGAEPLLAAPAQAVCPPRPDERHEAVKVLDGTTLLLSDGREVRLAGVSAPEPPAAVTADAWLPALDAKTDLSELVSGKTVELTFGKSRKDRYGRLIAEVDVTAAHGTTLSVATELIRQGQALAVWPLGWPECGAALFRQRLVLEEAARSAHSGLWGHAAYQTLTADRPADISAHRADFALVVGTVATAVDRGNRLYLNFGSDWRRDFTVSVPGRLLNAAPEARTALLALGGKRVRVRGWIERRNGPSIEVRNIAEIELLDAGP